MRRVIFRSSSFSVAAPTIIFFNFIVFVMWQLSSGTPDSFMGRHFLVSASALREGRLWTIFTSIYSHNMFLHFFLNMYVLSSFGPIIERLLGYRKFMRFYLTAGAVSSAAHALACTYLLQKPELPALGASGAIAGLILLFSLTYPKEKILILGIIPMPAIFGALAFIGLDLWGLMAQVGGHGLPIGHGAHLGGAITGIIYYFFQLRPSLLKERERQMRSQVEPIVIDTDYTRLP